MLPPVLTPQHVSGSGGVERISGAAVKVALVASGVGRRRRESADEARQRLLAAVVAAAGERLILDAQRVSKAGGQVGTG